MILLAIDTSTRYAGTAIADDERVLSTRCWYSSSSHTAQLMPAVSALMDEQGLTTQDLDGIVVALGPGGFSALRVGLSVAKGLAMAPQKPLVGIGTLELEAYPYLRTGLPVYALLDSGRKELASASFGADGLKTRPDTICSLDELLPEIIQPAICCGEGVVNWESVLRESLGDMAIIIKWAPAARLWSLVEMGRHRLESGESDDLALLQPYYLRMPSIGGPKRRDLTPQQS